MTPSVIRIGGVSVEVSSAAPRMVPFDDPYVAGFRMAAGVDVSPHISVEVVEGRAPKVEGPALFDCDGSWSCYRDGTGYRLVTWSGPSGEAELVACADATTASVRVYVGEMWTRTFAPSSGDTNVLRDPIHYPLDQLLLMNHLAPRGGIIVHSAGLEHGGAGFCFPGVSGAGKTTLSRVLTAAGVGEGLLSDDRTVLRVRDHGAAEVWGTPWPGDAGIARNRCAPLRGLYFLEHASEPEIARVAPAEGARRLFPTISCAWYDHELAAAVLDTVDRLVGAVPCFVLRFTPDERTAEVLLSHAQALA